MATNPRTDDPIAALVQAVGADAVLTDEASCAFYAQDVFSLGPRALAVVRPADKDALARAVGAATAHGLAVAPRGGGMSYTSGYVPRDAGAVMLDLSAMNRVLQVDETDMTVTVEAGCTWAKLHETLKPLKLRTPFWGTLSGLYATVGGGMSQNGLFWGGRHGTIVESALSMEVVLADGTLLKTGPDFFRPYGPDLTGLFAADAGAFGVKATVTLRLMREATAFAYGSFAFDSHAQILAAMSAIAREGLASECFGFDPFLQAQRMKRESLAKDAKALLGVMKAQGSFWKAVKEGAKVVAAGRSFLDDVPFSCHVICEGRHQGGVDADLAAIERIVAANGGRPVENSIPKILRANPFGPVNSMLGPEGERWVPVHGILPHSKGRAAIEAILALYEEHAAAMAAQGVGAGYMFAVVGTNGLLIEPVFFWPDAMEELHRRSVEPAHLARLKGFAANPPARALVERLREAVIERFQQHGAIHFQIGKTYPYQDALDPRAKALVAAIKNHLDPQHRVSPGNLGID
jgi:FAD/FMN-containing dehydrogenase